LLVPSVNRAFGLEFRVASLLQPQLWALVLLLLALISLIGGAYPALVLSRVRPVEALRAGSVRAGPRFVPTVLVGVQFAAASFLLVSALLMMNQNRDVRRQGVRVDRDPVVVISNDLRELKVSFEAVRAELLRDPHIKSVSASASPPWQSGGTHQVLAAAVDPGAPQETTILNLVSYDFFPTLGMKILAGRTLDREHGDELGNFWIPPSPGKELRIVVDRSLA